MSYNAEIDLHSTRKGNIEVQLWAGSYNPGNQPDYGEDWEYYHVSVYQMQEDGTGDLLKKKTFHNVDEARNYYLDTLRRYDMPLPSKKKKQKEVKKPAKIKIINGRTYYYQGTYEGQSHTQTVGRRIKRGGDIDYFRTVKAQNGNEYHLYVAK
jgi:hypothetical protein